MQTHNITYFMHLTLLTNDNNPIHRSQFTGVTCNKMVSISYTNLSVKAGMLKICDNGQIFS